MIATPFTLLADNTTVGVTTTAKIKNTSGYSVYTGNGVIAKNNDAVTIEGEMLNDSSQAVSVIFGARFENASTKENIYIKSDDSSVLQPNSSISSYSLKVSGIGDGKYRVYPAVFSASDSKWYDVESTMSSIPVLFFGDVDVTEADTIAPYVDMHGVWQIYSDTTNITVESAIEKITTLDFTPGYGIVAPDSNPVVLTYGIGIFKEGKLQKTVFNQYTVANGQYYIANFSFPLPILNEIGTYQLKHLYMVGNDGDIHLSNNSNLQFIEIVNDGQYFKIQKACIQDTTVTVELNLSSIANCSNFHITRNSTTDNFDINIYCSADNNNEKTYSCDYGIALMQNEKIIQIVNACYYVIMAYNTGNYFGGYYSNTLANNISHFGASLQDGNYQLKPCYRLSGTKAWLFSKYVTSYLNATITGNELDISLTNGGVPYLCPEEFYCNGTTGTFARKTDDNEYTKIQLPIGNKWECWTVSNRAFNEFIWLEHKAIIECPQEIVLAKVSNFSDAFPDNYTIQIADSIPDGTYPLKIYARMAGYDDWVLGTSNHKTNIIVNGDSVTVEYYDDETGISEVEDNAKSADSYYDLAGRRTDSPAKGIYIYKGKKFICK